MIVDTPPPPPPSALCSSSFDDPTSSHLPIPNIEEMTMPPPLLCHVPLWLPPTGGGRLQGSGAKTKFVCYIQRGQRLPKYSPGHMEGWGWGARCVIPVQWENQYWALDDGRGDGGKLLGGPMDHQLPSPPPPPPAPATHTLFSQGGGAGPFGSAATASHQARKDQEPGHIRIRNWGRIVWGIWFMAKCDHGQCSIIPRPTPNPLPSQFLFFWGGGVVEGNGYCSFSVCIFVFLLQEHWVYGWLSSFRQCLKWSKSY